MDLLEVSQKVAIAVGLGLLVGLQRERVQSPLAGIRTFALITVFGAVCALLGMTLGGWIVALGSLAVASILVVGNLARGKAEEVEPGVTTEMAALLMYGVGAYLVVGHTAVAIAIGGGVALLLQWKVPMHEFVARIGDTDIKAIMRFVLVALVIYPVLPDKAYGPYKVFNPQQIWLMVVLIVGIGLGGYLGYKLFGQRSGALVAGILGGLISSTATTVSFARHTRQTPRNISTAALVIVVASTAVFVRILVEFAVVAPTKFWNATLPLGVMFGWMTVIAAGAYYLARVKEIGPVAKGGQSDLSANRVASPGRDEAIEPPTQSNPAELTPALIFGGLYALVLFGTAAARDYFGTIGLYVVAIISGLHDLDAITLSTARFVEQGQVETQLSWRIILTAAMSNLVVKYAVAALLGGHRLLKWIVVPYGMALLGGTALLVFWPQTH